MVRLICIFVFVSFISAQEISIEPAVISPTIDGIVNRAEYNASDSASTFFQLQPFNNETATEKTVVLISFDSKNIYFGIKCYDSEPGKLVKNIQTRDGLSSQDDAIFIILDTYADKRTAYGFGINVLNTQSDLRITDNGRNTDFKWDAKWTSAATVTKFGWSAEIAIPFSSLSYDETTSNWNICFRRVMKKKSEIDYWPVAPTYEYQISKSGIINGLVIPARKKVFSVTPYATFRLDNTESTNNKNDFSTEIGGDIQARITSGLVGNLTINPDFATVEGDQEEINMTRYELSFPEKRLFFMEGSELFSTRIKTFYSRRIGEIDAGMKMSGKIDDYSVSVIGVRTPERNEISEPATYFSAVRIKKDILESSNIGITFADKSSAGNFNRSLSFDYTLNLSDTWKLTGQLVGSAPGNFTKNMGWFLRFANESNLHHVHIRYTELGENFRENVNQTGYITDDDRKEIDSDISYTWWFKNSFVKYIDAASRNNIFWSQNGVLRGYRFTQDVSIYLTNKFSFELNNKREFRLFEDEFYNYSYELELGYNTEEWASAELDYEWGENFNAGFNLLTAEIRISPVKNMALEYSLNKLEFTNSEELPNSFINILSADYNFTPNLWIRLLAQTNSVNNRVYFYGLFGWRIKPPFNAVYFIYTFDQFENNIFISDTKNRILYLKFSYQLDF